MARQRFGVRLSSAAFSPFENQPSAQLNRTLSRYPFALQVAAHKNVLVPVWVCDGAFPVRCRLTE